MSRNGEGPERASTRKAKITQATVAKAVGVDKSTVSIVLSGSPRAERISERTRRRIMAAAEQLNYRPNVFASELRKGRSSFILLCVPTLQERDIALMAESFERRAFERGFRVIVSCFKTPDENRRLVENILGPHGISALAMVTEAREMYDEDSFMELLEQGIHPVLLGRTHPDPRVSYVIWNHFEAGRLAMRHLGEQDIFDPVIMWDPSDTSEGQKRRIEGAREIAPSFGVHDVEMIAIGKGRDSVTEAYDAMSRRLARGRMVRGLLTTRDSLAHGAVRAFLEAGHIVGEDVSIISCGERTRVTLAGSGITSVRPPFARIGSDAADAVIDRVEEITTEATRRIVAPEIVIRSASFAPAVAA